MGNPKSSEEFLSRQIKTKPLRVPDPAPRVFSLPKGKLSLDQIIVVPLEPPRQSAGGILHPDKTRAAEQALTTVGQVHAIGPLAYTTVTRDGLDFTKANRAAVGDWVIYSRSAGQLILLRDDSVASKVDWPRFLIMSDADIKFVFESKEDALQVWSWTR